MIESVRFLVDFGLFCSDVMESKTLGVEFSHGQMDGTGGFWGQVKASGIFLTPKLNKTGDWPGVGACLLHVSP